MSKISLLALSDEDVNPKVIGALVEAYRTANEPNRFPDALLVSKDQAEKFFFEGGQVLTNFRGIPLEVEAETDKTAAAITTINSIIKGMHIGSVTQVSEVYRLLENMKEKIYASI